MITVRPKRKIGYLPPIELTTRDSIEERTIEKGARKRGANSLRRVPGSLNRSVDLSPQPRSGTLSDRSYVSTASSNSQKARQRVLVEKNRQRPVIPEAIKERALRMHANIPSRYNESPYVLKFQNRKDRNSSTDRNSESPIKNSNEFINRGQTPKTQKTKHFQKLHSTNL